jgi:hypothetical protein
MVQNIAIFFEEMEEMNIKWLQRLFVKKHFEKVKLWIYPAHYTNCIPTNTRTCSINWCREDDNDVKGPSQHEENKLRTLGNILKGLGYKTDFSPRKVRPFVLL